MSNFRSFAPELDPDQDEITLTPFESHHLVTTNRAREGATVTIFDGAGTECEATLKVADRRSALLTPNVCRRAKHQDQQITLAVALIKGKNFETLLRQATELGVTSIQPLITERTLIQIKNDSAKREKWSKHLVEACKQSGNPWLPDLKEPMELEKYLEHADLDSSVVASLEKNAKACHSLSLSRNTTVFIGPEGDFTSVEYQSLEEKGVQPMSLGRYVLKSETAAVAALSQLSQFLKSANF